ncbi:major capsid protein [Microviridae sp.]|nr:major capsid protein [Microviridae sp.]
MSERIVQQPVNTAVQAKFSDLPTADVERSTFDMSHSWKGTMESWQLIPTMCMEVLPGDTFNAKSTIFMRLATPIKPVMDNLTADIHYFFVPNRLVWDNWQFFMGERIDPDDDPTTVSVPQVAVDFNVQNVGLDSVKNVLADAFGLPMYNPGDTTPVLGNVNALPFRAYALIYNDWYRNQNINDSVPIPRGDGPDAATSEYTEIKFRHKRADYFTRALPWPQKGDPVFLPLGDSAPVTAGRSVGGDFFTFVSPATGKEIALRRDGNDESEVGYVTDDGSILPVNDPFFPFMNVDLSVATAATINDIRTAFQIQRLLERDARGGTRYIEIILSHFNVQSPDARLQRPEYLGGGTSRITVNPVAATAETTDTPQGNLAAVATGLLKGGFNHSFTEHGYVIGILSVRSDQTYQRGLDRMWSRETRYDYYWPALSHLGEQAIKNKEIYLEVGDESADEIWGYQERYAEYRYQPGRITGKFRSEDTASLDVWHLSQDWTEMPVLNGFFVLDIPPIDRVVAVPSEPDFLVDAWHDVKATRPMPVYAVPGMVDHF